MRLSASRRSGDAVRGRNLLARIQAGQRQRPIISPQSAEMMTKNEWMRQADPVVMIKSLPALAYKRKLRLFAVACCRQIWNLLEDKTSREAVVVAERFADGMATEEELAAAREEAWAVATNRRSVRTPETVISWIAAAMARETAQRQAGAIEVANWAKGTESTSVLSQANLLRDLIRYPACSVKADRRDLVLIWQGGTVPLLAQDAYDYRSGEDGALDPVRLNILADAMTDAGCADEELVAHLRTYGPHYRGCWAIDWALERKLD